MSPPSLWSRVSALFALAVVPLALAGACAGGSRDAADQASIVPPRYSGALSCLDCAAIDTRVTLFAGDSFLLEETYRATRDGDRTYRSRGTWASLGDAANPSAGRILMLSPNAGETRRFRMLGDTALRQLDRTGNELKTKANTLLKREP
ncbi:MAG: copper resistance protein NlpE N-terminal domain-containing protein [Gemmatimonadales bacterium]|nr:copper resistance protein NlpE N-terminal domain-containing protein [Gemmatimonadota bacterium]MCL4213263.1 copper resistance protein NlpE N-terminal domain-containing protein [Gemmatimonadales bacterium]